MTSNVQDRGSIPDSAAESTGDGLRITHVIDTLQVGGAEIMLASLARIQQRRGARVRVVCLLGSGPLEDLVRKHGIDVYCCRNNPLVPSLWGKLRTLFELRREFRSWRTEVAHFHNITPTLYGAPAALLAGVKGRFCTRHSCRPETVWTEPLFWKVMRLCHKAVAVSAAVRDTITALPYARPVQVATIPNGVAPLEDTRPAVPKTGFTLVTVARLAHPKDHATLLRAVARSASDCPDLRLLVVGSGPLESELQTLCRELGIGERVFFAGERHDVGNWLASADAFVLSSLSEGLPMAMLEAMAAGLPMILSDVGGIREVAGDLPAATLVPAGDPESLAQAICDFFARRQKLRSLGEIHRRRFEERYSAEAMADSYSRLYACPEGAVVPFQVVAKTSI